VNTHFGRWRRAPHPEPEPPRKDEARTAPPRVQPEFRRIRISFDQRSVQATTIRILVIVSAWMVAAWVVGVARHFLFLILLAWLAAIASEPAIRWFLRRGLSRTRSTAIVGTSVIVISLGLAVVFEQMLLEQATQLVRSIPSTVRTIVDQLNQTFDLQLDATQVTATLHLDPSQIQGLADDLAGGVIGALGTLVAVTFDVVTVVVFTFYIAAAGPRLVQHVAVWLPPDRQPVLGEIWDIAEQKTGGYVASKIVLAAMSAVFHGIFFWAVDLPGWLPLALLAGITAQFIPVIGTYIGVAVPVVVALADRPVVAIWIVVFAIIYQQIETYVFTPKVSHRTMEVNPAIALAAVFLGAAIWGPIGAIIGVPIAAVVASIMETYGRRYELVPHLALQADNGADPVPTPVAEPPADTDPAPHDALPEQSGPGDEAGPAIDTVQDSEPPGARS